MVLPLIIIPAMVIIVIENNMIIDANALTLRDKLKRSMLHIWRGKVVSVPEVRKAIIKSSKDNVKVNNPPATTAGVMIGSIM